MNTLFTSQKDWGHENELEVLGEASTTLINQQTVSPNM